MWTTLLFCLSLLLIPSVVVAEKAASMVSNNSLLAGMELLSYQQDAERKRFEAEFAMLSLELFGPFRVKAKGWQVRPEKTESFEGDRKVDELTESLTGWFSGIEVVNTLAFLRIAFAIGYQSTSYLLDQNHDSPSVGKFEAKSENVDSGPALLGVIEMHLGGPFLASLNFGANHRQNRDRTDAFAGVGLGLAY